MKVGEYIHWRYSNYEKYGLSIDGSKGRGNGPYGALAAQRKTMQQILPDRVGQKENIRDQLEKQINFFYDINNSSINVGYNAEDQDRLEKIMIEACQKAINNLGVNLNRVSINWNNLLATGGGSVNIGKQAEEFAKIRKTIIGGLNKKGEIKQTSKEGAVYRRVLELQTLRDNLVESGSNGHYDQKFINKMRNLEGHYKKIIQDLEESTGGEFNIGYNTKKNKDEEKSGRGNKVFKIQGKKKQNFVKQLNELLAMTKQITDTQVAGYLGEYMPAISQAVADEIATKGLQELYNEIEKNGTDYIIDLISGKMVGDKRSRKTVLSSNVINQFKFADSDEAHIGEVKVNTSYTQDKVDVHLSLPGNQVINASMKNVALNSKHNINILSGTSSLNLIQDYPEFANHYLNITANIGREDFPSDNLLTLYHNEIKQVIALHSLVGGVWGQEHQTGLIKKNDMAEILVVNDSSSKYGRFKVYFMSDILNNIKKNINLINIEEFENVRQYKNTWIGKKDINNLDMAWARVAEILSQLHTQKLKVSISPLALS